VQPLERLKRSIIQADDFEARPSKRHKLASRQLEYVRDWGSTFLVQADSVAKGFKHWVKQLPAIPLTEDCSGVHAPHFAMKTMGMKVINLGACDYAAGPQKFARRNIDCQTYHPDLFNKSTAGTPSHSTIFYTAGFPCKPFSSLRSSSQFLEDKEARQFFQVCDEMEHLRPMVIILENVMGIRKVLKQVLARLHHVGDYYITTQSIDPLLLGAPIARNRIYFIMVNREVIQDLPDKALTARVEEVLEACECNFNIEVKMSM
jgi:site-specific DNA-cytosine methylase